MDGTILFYCFRSICAERICRASRRRLHSFLHRRLVFIFYLGGNNNFDYKYGCCDQLVAALLVKLIFLRGWMMAGLYGGYGLVGTGGGMY